MDGTDAATSALPVPQRQRGSATIARYAAAAAITVFAIASQYFLPQLVPALQAVYDNLPGDLAVVYGVPIVAFLVLVGTGPLQHATDRMRSAVWEGFRWYGSMAAVALVLTTILAVVYTILDPSALALLNRPNPALELAQGNPWFFVGFSFVIGAFEETIFRGWIFGFWLGRTRGWIGPAVWTSMLFAAVHLYYGTTYGAAAPLIFPTLFLTGFGFAAAMRYSGGNIVVIALLHGATDAAAYLTLVSTTDGLLLHYGLVLIGLAIALATYLSATYRVFDPPYGWWASDSASRAEPPYGAGEEPPSWSAERPAGAARRRRRTHRVVRTPSVSILNRPRLPPEEWRPPTMRACARF
ncbi:MAG: CPBP family intramembrane glutamic endopeptidase [Thermoplasmata archaeon]